MALPLAAIVVLVADDFHVWATGGLETMLFALAGVAAILLTRLPACRGATGAPARCSRCRAAAPGRAPPRAAGAGVVVDRHAVDRHCSE